MSALDTQRLVKKGSQMVVCSLGDCNVKLSAHVHLGDNEEIYFFSLKNSSCCQKLDFPWMTMKISYTESSEIMYVKMY